MNNSDESGSGLIIKRPSEKLLEEMVKAEAEMRLSAEYLRRCDEVANEPDGWLRITGEMQEALVDRFAKEYNFDDDISKTIALQDMKTAHFKYPNNSTKADLVIKTKDETIVFELKSFVLHQDANKKGSYPIQIKALETIVNSHFCKQGVTFTTFMGYSKKQVDSMLVKFFTNNKRKSDLMWMANSQFAFHVSSYII